jgi:octaprenyl-diphosphate synthase
MQLSQSFDISLDVNRYLEIIKAKTAALFAASTKVGSIIGAKNQQDVDLMHDYGINLGIAFQITDDIIDYSKNSGKTLGNDFYEGKITLPIINAYNAADNHTKNRIRYLFTKTDKNHSDLEEIIDILDHTESLKSSYELAREYSGKSIKALENLKEINISIEILTILRNTSVFLIDRDH